MSPARKSSVRRSSSLGASSGGTIAKASTAPEPLPIGRSELVAEPVRTRRNRTREALGKPRPQRGQRDVAQDQTSIDARPVSLIRILRTGVGAANDDHRVISVRVALTMSANGTS